MSEENADDMETTEADGELQIITEVSSSVLGSINV